ncbi:MAG: methyltransferase domain-containing protein [Chloroflexota bacterium]|nr:methyltransferase domain-containing protein [Chloroflexota bacterium]
MSQADVRLEPTANEVKQCCADLYAGDWVRLLLGDSFHPGGLALTSRLGALLALGPNDRVLDVASGSGASALHLTETFGCYVTGVDYSADNVARANQTAREAGVASSVAFVHGDAEQLDLPATAYDVVICECALCTFPNKGAAVREFRRVLRPGGRLGISDVTRDGPLPAELDNFLARVACIADALPAREYVALLTGAGFSDAQVEQHDEAARELIERVRVGLLGAQVLAGVGKLSLPVDGADLRHALNLANVAAGAARDGRLGYALIVARAAATG